MLASTISFTSLLITIVLVLLMKRIVWMVGVVWSFSFQWPESIASIFRRRCPLNQATFVAVVAPVRKVETIAPKKGKSYCDELARALWLPFHVILSFYFSYRPTPPDCETVYCPVDSRTFSFHFHMGRYVYSESDGMYIPGVLELGTTIGDFLDMRPGLTVDQAGLHYQLVGANIIPLEKPNLFKSLYKEFSQTFYLYQTFMLWTWFNYWYYHMALISTVVRLIGGTVVGVFQYQSDCVMHKLSEVEGIAE
jgi:hypothetical protein